jgi:hypothetical protein
VLSYPWTAETLAWGAILGVVGVLTTMAAQQAAQRLAGTGQIVASCGAFVAAFAVYEGALFMASVSAMGGTEDFAPAIVGEILTINAAAFVGLLVLNRLGAIIGLGAKPETLRQLLADAANTSLPVPMAGGREINSRTAPSSRNPYAAACGNGTG